MAASVAALIAAFAPLGQRQTPSLDTTGESVATSTITSTNLVSSEGTWVLLLVAIPVMIALVPVLVARRGARVVASVLLWAFCLVGLASIGLFFVPAAALMTVALFVHEPRPASAAAMA